MKTFTEIFQEEFGDWKSNKLRTIPEVAKASVEIWLKQERKVYKYNFDTIQYEVVSKLLKRL